MAARIVFEAALPALISFPIHCGHCSNTQTYDFLAPIAVMKIWPRESGKLPFVQIAADGRLAPTSCRSTR